MSVDRTALADIDGIAYDLAGDGEPALLLLHGWCCDRGSMSPLARRLSTRHRVVNIDLRGHGMSSAPATGYGSRELVEDVVAVAQAAGVERPVLVGHSLGGRVVLATADRYPDLACALVLLDTAVIEAPAYVAARRAELGGPAWQDGLRARVDRMFLPGDHSPARARITAGFLSAPLGSARAALAAADEIDAGRALRDCRLPVLYIGSSSPRADPQTLRELKPDLIYARVAPSGHFVQIDAADRVADLIERFAAAA